MACGMRSDAVQGSPHAADKRCTQLPGVLYAGAFGQWLLQGAAAHTHSHTPESLCYGHDYMY